MLTHLQCLFNCSVMLMALFCLEFTYAVYLLLKQLVNESVSSLTEKLFSDILQTKPLITRKNTNYYLQIIQ